MPKYNVISFVTVITKAEGVDAPTPQAAAKQIYETTDYYALVGKEAEAIPIGACPFPVPYVEFNEDVQCFLVDELDAEGHRVRSHSVYWAPGDGLKHEDGKPSVMIQTISDDSDALVAVLEEELAEPEAPDAAL